MKDYLVSLAEYNVWANKKILDFVKAAGEGRGRMEQVSSFESILQTVLHIHNAQTIWFSRVNGHSPLTWPIEPFNGSVADAATELVNSSKDFILFVKGLPEDELFKTIHYKNIIGQPFTNTLLEIVTHVMNHGTFHRGQLITMFRVAGHTQLETTDLISFFREPKSS